MSNKIQIKRGCTLLLKAPSKNQSIQTTPLFILNSSSTNQQQLKESQVVRHLKKQKNEDITQSLHYFKTVPFKHTLSTYKTIILKLSRLGLTDQVHYLLQQMKLDHVSCSEDLFISVIDCYSRARLSDQALKLFYRIHEFGCVPTVKIYNHLLDSLLNENKFRMITPLYNNMQNDGLEPNVFTYNVLIKALCKSLDRRGVDAAIKMLDEMTRKGCLPDEVSFTTVVSAMCKVGLVDEARGVVAGRRRRSCCVQVYNALVHGLCREGRFDEAFQLLGEMVMEGVSPNVVTYSTVVNCLCDVGDVSLSLGVLAGMFKKGCSPNVYTYCSLMKGYFKDGRLCGGLALWERMVPEGVERNVVAYNALLHGLCSNGYVDKAVSFLREMEDTTGCSPNVTTYSILIDSFSKLGKLVRASDMWNEMISRGCRPNVVAYTSMVDALCRNALFDQAHSLIENMAAENCPPNTLTFNTFIKGLSTSGRIDCAIKILDEMERYGCSPNITTINELLDGLFKEKRVSDAFGLFRETEERGIDLNTVSYNTMLHGFSRSGRFSEALHLVGRMLVTGTKLDAVTYNLIIYVYCKQGKIDAATQLMDVISSRGSWCPDIITHTCLIGGICQCIGIEEAVDYLHKMLNEGTCPNVATWNVLIQSFFSKIGHMGPIRILDDILDSGWNSSLTV